MRAELDRQIDELEYQIQELKSRAAELRRQRPPEAVRDYAFRGPDGGTASLGALFGGRDRLILVHNMGRSCAYCTMWADGFSGLLPHLQSTAAFVVTSPDEPADQQRFAASRGWRFPMYSASREFIDDMGFLHPEEGLMPGVSVFTRAPGGEIHRVGTAEFGPGDDFCAVWHFLDLFPGGSAGWEPRYSYAPAQAGSAAPAGCCH